MPRACHPSPTTVHDTGAGAVLLPSRAGPVPRQGGIGHRASGESGSGAPQRRQGARAQVLHRRRSRTAPVEAPRPPDLQQRRHSQTLRHPSTRHPSLTSRPRVSRDPPRCQRSCPIRAQQSGQQRSDTGPATPANQHTHYEVAGQSPYSNSSTVDSQAHSASSILVTRPTKKPQASGWGLPFRLDRSGRRAPSPHHLDGLLR